MIKFFLLMFLSSFAFGSIPTIDNNTQPLSIEELESINVSDSVEVFGQCRAVVIVDEIRFFGSSSEVESFCRGRYNHFGVNSGCFRRGFNDGRWEGNFAFRLVFSGDSWRSNYNNWSRGRFNHRIEFNEFCYYDY